MPSEASDAPATRPTGSPDPTDASDDRLVTPTGDEPWVFLDGARTFDPLIADPRWPTMNASYRWVSNDPYLQAYEAVNIGGTIALARGPVVVNDTAIETEFSVGAGTFSVFNPHSSSQDLIATDFVGTGHLAVRRGRWSGLLRYWHLSGHVGDEFLIDPRYEGATRVNFKHETFQLLGSFDIGHGLRVYAGPTYRFSYVPEGLGDFQVQYGLEYVSDYKLASLARPTLAVDVQHLEGLDWQPDLSLRTGLTFDRGRRGPQMQILGEFYNGRNPNGQFYEDDVLFTGIGIYLRW